MFSRFTSEALKARRSAATAARKAEALIMRGAPVAARLALAYAIETDSAVARAEKAHAARLAYAADSAARRAFRR